MISPALELQDVILATLQADPTVSGLVDGIYDAVPDKPWSGARNAYISFGPWEGLVDDADCITSESQTIQIDVWSRAVGSVQCKRICDAVKRALHEQPLVLADNALVEVSLKIYHILRDPDGLTSHGAMQFTAYVEESD